MTIHSSDKIQAINVGFRISDKRKVIMYGSADVVRQGIHEEVGLATIQVPLCGTKNI